MLKLRFDGDNRIINLIEPNGDTKSLPFEFTSEPRISPDNQKESHIHITIGMGNKRESLSFGFNYRKYW